MTPGGFHTITLGCKLNQFDGAAIEGELTRRGFVAEPDRTRAGVVVINTCTVTHKADAEARRLVRSVRRHNPRCTLLVTGCYAELDAAAVAAIDGVDRVFGNRDKPRLGSILDELGLIGPAATGDRGCDASTELPRALHFGDRTRAFLKIQEGCRLSCSYCIIPTVRGPSRSVATPEIREVLAGLVRSNTSPRVFTLSDGRGMPHALDRVWRRVRNLAGLSGLRLHDLRHSYASVAVSGGEELRTVAALLGHAELETTMGYAHLAEAPLAAAAGRIATKLADSLTPAEPLEAIQPAPRKPTRPPPALPADDNLTAEERWWERQIRAYRKSRLRLKPFCEARGLDPVRMHQALRHHHERAKAWRRLGR